MWHKYDNDGNRIKRYYECISTLPTSKSAGSEDSVATAPEPTIEIDKFTGEVFPNPTNGLFNIRISKPLDNAPIKILDMHGRTIFDGTISGVERTIDISSYQPGIYIIQIKNESQELVFKIVKL